MIKRTRIDLRVSSVHSTFFPWTSEGKCLVKRRKRWCLVQMTVIFFLTFVFHHMPHKKVGESMPFSFRILNAEIVSRWKTLTASERQFYENKAKQDRLRYIEVIRYIAWVRTFIYFLNFQRNIWNIHLRTDLSRNHCGKLNRYTYVNEEKGSFPSNILWLWQCKGSSWIPFAEWLLRKIFDL